jgi:DNA invertase Pin-like site-specific DNA recombinase
MIDAGTSKPAPFDVLVVHSFSRFFRDAFDMEFYVRKLAKKGVKLLSITQEIGDDPVHQMMRRIMALFDEYQSKENAKHVMRALLESPSWVSTEAREDQLDRQPPGGTLAPA